MSQNIDLNLRDGVKMTRETLCAAQAALVHGRFTYDRADEHIERLGLVILELDRHRPLGPNGKHGDRHTATCGCEEIPTGEATA